MFKLKKIWNNFIKEIQKSNDNKYKEIIKIKKKTIEILEETIEILEETNNFLREDLNKQEIFYSYKIKELKNKIPKEINFKVKKDIYNFRRKGNEPLRFALNKFSKDVEYIEKYTSFIKQNLNLKNSYSNPDKLIYDICRELYDYIDNKYESDKYEYWHTPQEAFNVYITEKEAGDCDDTRAFMYACIVTALINYNLWEENKDRLLAVDIKRPIGHAVLAWKKSNDVWALLESTYYEDRFSINWNENCNIFKSCYTKIWHIFDEKSEYILQ